MEDSSTPHTTMIVIYKANTFHPLTWYFMGSVTRQKSLELVVIHREETCADISHLTRGAPNIRVRLLEPMIVASSLTDTKACVHVGEHM